MKISNFMQQSPVTVFEDQPIRDAVRLIFNLGLSAVLVTKDKKLVGVITETDILHHLFPSVREFMEDYVNSRDFDLMEQNMAGLLAQPVSTIMTKNVTTITPDTPVLHAQSLLLLNKFSHLPVVKEDKKLVGIISQGDIFRALASEEIPYETDSEYHEWVSRYYDMVIKQKKRSSKEIESLTALFKKSGVKRVIDVGCGTGNHVIGLAKEGFELLGLEKIKGFYASAQKKCVTLDEREKNRIMLVQGESYPAMLERHRNAFDAVIFMGNFLAHIPDNYQAVLGAAEQCLDAKKGMMVLHLVNTDRVLNRRKRLQDFNVAPSNSYPKHEYAFMEFYDPPHGDATTITLTMSILQYNGRRWSMMGVNSTPLAYLTPASVTSFLKSLGFSHVDIYGSNYGDALFDRKFDKDNDEWFTAVARR